MRTIDLEKVEDKEYFIVPFGGGVNSGAMLVKMIELGIYFDFVIFSDTGSELPRTYLFLDEMDQYLVDHGFDKIQRISRRTFANTEIQKESLYENLHRTGNIPSVAYSIKTCSYKFKIEPQIMWYRSKGIDPNKVTSYIGYDYGEINRMRRSNAKNGHMNIYPLIDLKIDRQGCIDILKEAGFKNIGKSSCFFCPNMKRQEVLDLKEEYPDLYAKALELEERMYIGNDRRTSKGLAANEIRGLGRKFKWSEYTLEEAREQLEIMDFYIEMSTASGCEGDCDL